MSNKLEIFRSNRKIGGKGHLKESGVTTQVRMKVEYLTLMIKQPLKLILRNSKFRVCYIISRNHSNMFLLINLQKTKTFPK